MNRGKVDAIVQVGTNLAMARLAGVAEFWLDKPVLAINTCIYWWALRQNGIDDKIESKLDFAVHPRFGYLTACPTNVGTGIRVSVMLHLPALKLTGEIEKVFRAAKDMRLAVRGLYGEGTEATGDFYQISNQTTLGKTEDEIISDFKHLVIPKIIDYEHHARRTLVNLNIDRIRRRRITEVGDGPIEVLADPELAKRLGRAGKEHARERFLTPRLLRDWMQLFTDLEG